MSFDFSTLDTSVPTTPQSVTQQAAADASANAGSAADTSQTFMKLLVTQMQNQDPLNPMDNSEMTSQLAQINTVDGIDTLNTTVQGLNSQFVQMQALQGASLVGQTVWVQGDQLNQVAGDSTTTATAAGGFNLASAANAVSVQVMDSTGKVVDTVQMGGATAGRHTFDWSKDGVTDTTGYTFKVTATENGNAVASTAQMVDKVDSVSIQNGNLTLSLQDSGDVPYSSIIATD